MRRKKLLDRRLQGGWDDAIDPLFALKPPVSPVNRMLTMPEKDTDTLARQLWAVGDAARIRILNLLPVSAECEHGNNVSQLAAKLKLSQPTVSHHLRVLRQAGLVESRKMCRGVFYWIRTQEAQEVIGAMEKLLYKRDGLRE